MKRWPNRPTRQIDERVFQHVNSLPPRASAALFVALLLSVFLSGCQPDRRPQAYNVSVHLSESLRDSSGAYPGVDVFLKGVSPWERQQTWEKQPDLEAYTRYRGPPTQFDVERSLRLGAGEQTSQLLSSTDSAWQRWLDAGATDLIVISNFPRQRPAGTGRDRRLLIIPLARDRFPDNNLRVEVTREGLELLTPPSVKSR
jgi:hypothetical protein